MPRILRPPSVPPSFAAWPSSLPSFASCSPPISALNHLSVLHRTASAFTATDAAVAAAANASPLPLTNYQQQSSVAASSSAPTVQIQPGGNRGGSPESDSLPQPRVADLTAFVRGLTYLRRSDSSAEPPSHPYGSRGSYTPRLAATHLQSTARLPLGASVAYLTDAHLAASRSAAAFSSLKSSPAAFPPLTAAMAPATAVPEPAGAAPPPAAAAAAAVDAQVQQPATERRFRCYTKTGDKGSSSLYNGERRRKDDAVFHALGDVDELNSAVGLASEYAQMEGLTKICEQIAVIQSRLLDVGSAVATPIASSAASKVKRVRFDAGAVDTLEHWLDEMDDQLPPLCNFILPSGGLAATHLHVARSICRRAERAVVSLAEPAARTEAVVGSLQQAAAQAGVAAVEAAAAEASASGAGGEVVEASVIRFLNRLSDYLFTAARFAALKAGREETTYKKA